MTNLKVRLSVLILSFAELGPYTVDYTSSGRHMVVAGRKGHVAIIDMKTMGLIRELQVSFGS